MSYETDLEEAKEVQDVLEILGRLSEEHKTMIYITDRTPVADEEASEEFRHVLNMAGIRMAELDPGADLVLPNTITVADQMAADVERARHETDAGDVDDQVEDQVASADKTRTEQLEQIRIYLYDHEWLLSLVENALISVEAQLQDAEEKNLGFHDFLDRWASLNHAAAILEACLSHDNHLDQRIRIKLSDLRKAFLDWIKDEFSDSE